MLLNCLVFARLDELASNLSASPIAASQSMPLSPKLSSDDRLLFAAIVLINERCRLPEIAGRALVLIFSRVRVDAINVRKSAQKNLQLLGNLR